MTDMKLEQPEELPETADEPGEGVAQAVISTAFVEVLISAEPFTSDRNVLDTDPDERS